jgi:hypothetical protein
MVKGMACTVQRRGQSVVVLISSAARMFLILTMAGVSVAHRTVLLVKLFALLYVTCLPSIPPGDEEDSQDDCKND